ncbi:MAG: hypothetical protein WC894_02000 [Patescibacteria group bacterium]
MNKPVQKPSAKETVELFEAPRDASQMLIGSGCGQLGPFVEDVLLANAGLGVFRCMAGGLCALARAGDCHGKHPTVVQNVCPDGITSETFDNIARKLKGRPVVQFDVPVYPPATQDS